MYINIKKEFMQYTGPLHYWNARSVNPRERYYYGYYGSYGPQVDLSLYTPINGVDTFDLSTDVCVCAMEGFDGCGCGGGWGMWFVWLFIALLIMYFMSTRGGRRRR